MFGLHKEKEAEMLQMKEEISLYMKEKIEPMFFQGYKKLDTIKGDPLDKMIWFPYKNQETEKISVFFEFHYAFRVISVSVRFHTENKSFSIRREEKLERIFNSFIVEMKKYALSKMYGK
jgi:hypothetical protein